MNKLQKIIAIGTALTTIAWMSGVAYFAPVTSAATAEELQAQIDKLMAELATLQSQLTALEGTPPSATTYEGIPADFQFTKFLKKGSKGDEVKYLQIVLQKEVGKDVVGKADGIFGKKTDAAVKQFQTNNDLVSDGLVGKNTRAKLNALLAAVPPAAKELTVVSVTPASNATNVAADSNVVVTLSMAVDSATVTADSVKLTTGTTAVEATRTVSDKTITIDPTADLAENTTYTVTLTTDVKATDGTALKAEYTSSFSTGATVVLPPTGGLTVELASDTPIAGIVPLAALGVPYTKIKITGAGKISQVLIKRTGYGHKDDFVGVALYEGDKKLTLSRTLSTDNTLTINLSPAIEVVSGTPKYITVAGDIATTASGNVATGNVDVLEVTSITADVTVNGTFPIKGNPMSLGAVSVGQLKVEAVTTTDTTINVGEQGQELARFKLTAATTSGASSSDDMEIRAIKLRQIGSASLTDLINFKLYKETTELTGLTLSTSGDYLTLEGLGLTLLKGNYVTLVLKGDVVSGGGQTIRFQVEEPSDITAGGKTYKYAYVHNGSTTWAEVNATQISLAAGELTLSITGPDAKTITPKEDNVVIAELTITALDASLISKLYGIIDGTDDNNPDGVLDNSIESVRLQKADGSVTYDAVALTDDNDDNFEFYFSNIDVPKGTSNWKVLFNTVDSVTDAGDTYQLYLQPSTSSGTQDGESLAAMSAKNSQGKAITDIKPGTTISGNLITLGSAILTVGDVALGSESVVAKTKLVSTNKLTLTAGSADDVTVTQMLFEDAAGNTATTAEAPTFYLYDASGNVLNPATSSSGTGADWTVSFTNINKGNGLKIAKGTQVTVYVKADIGSSITSGHILKVATTIDGITALKSDSTQLADDDIIGNDSNLNGRSITLVSRGILTISHYSEGGLTDAQVLAGDTAGFNSLKLKFNADYENVNVKKLILENIKTDSDNDAVASVTLIDGETTIVGLVNRPSAGKVQFGDGSATIFTVDKDVDKIITIKTVLHGIGDDEKTADSGDEIQWSLKKGGTDNGAATNIAATGASSSLDLRYHSTYASADLKFGLASPQADQSGKIYHARRAIVSALNACAHGSSTCTAPSTTVVLINGEMEVLRFQVTVPATANKAAAFDLKGLKITFNYTDPAGGTNLTLSSAKLYRLDYPLEIVNASTTDLATGVIFNEAVSGISALTDISPGSSAIFVVKATVSGAESTQNGKSTLQAKIANLGNQSNEGTTDFSAGALIWSDNDATITDDDTGWTYVPLVTELLGQQYSM